MSDERNIPDDLWRKAFDEAAETPPPRVWDVIEQRLDESNGPKVLPLWGAGPAVSRPMAWGVGLAAAVALLLVGWWIMRADSNQRPMVAQSQQSGQRQEQAQTLHGKQSESIAANGPAEAVGLTQQRAITSVRPEKGVPQTGGSLSVPLQPERSVALSGHRPVGSRLANKGGNHPSVQQPTADIADDLFIAPVDRSSSVALTNQPAAARFTEPTVAEPMMEKHTLTNFEQLASRPLQLRAPGPIQRIVWFRPADADAPELAVPKAKRNDREMWASVSMMPGAFNPSVSVQLPPAAAMAPSMSAAPVSQPSVNSRANFSVAYQAGAGVQLTERWSIESGVGYLAARSTVDSPGQTGQGQFALQAANVNNNAVAGNLYTDLLRTQTGQAVTKGGIYGMANDNLTANSRFNNLNNYNTRTSQSVTNNYQYVQVPVQIGYQLLPRKRLNLTVVGGLMTNIFVRNTVDDALVIKSKDGVYRPVSWAATMGARFRYRPSRRWSASMAGVYQPSLGLGTEVDSPIQSRPTSTGMTFGIDYHF